jgi:iron complex outermembrane receptor protein
VFAGSELPKSPKWKYNLTPRWELFTAAGSSIALLADFSWTASMWNDTERTYLLKRAAATNLNLSMTYKRKSSPWDVTLGGTNLTDDRSLASGFSQPGTGILSGTYTRGREYYASFNYKL